MAKFKWFIRPIMIYSEEVNTKKTTKTMFSEIIRRTAAYGLVEDNINNIVDVGDSSDRCVPIMGEGLRLLLRSCDYDNAWKLTDKRPYLDSGNILYTTCFDSAHERNAKRNEWLTRNCYPDSTVNKYGCCRSSFTCTVNGHQRHDIMRFETSWCNYFGY